MDKSNMQIITIPQNADSQWFKDQNAVWFKDQGNSFYNINQYDKAMKLYDMALKRSPSPINKAIIYKNKAAVFLRMEKSKEAVIAASVALSITPGDPKALFRRAQGYEQMQDVKSAFRFVNSLFFTLLSSIDVNFWYTGFMKKNSFSLFSFRKIIANFFVVFMSFVKL